MGSIRTRKGYTSLLLVLSCCLGAAHAEDTASSDGKKSDHTASAASSSTIKHRKKLDHSGEPRRGKASYYGREFFGRKMADGTPMNPHANIAASRTLPLGTKAKVTNLNNGKSAVVEIKDRGPYVDGRIVDLSPKVASELGFREKGLAPVEVTPIEVPLPDGSVKPGAAAPILQASTD